MRHQFAWVLCFLLSLGLLTSAGSAQPVQPLAILTPGEGSLVTAPLHLEAMVQPGGDGLIRVMLYDRQGDLLARHLVRVHPLVEGALLFETMLAFEILPESTQAILIVAIQDDAHRPLALRAVWLTLQQGGQQKIVAQDQAETWLSISFPEPGEVITQPPLVVTGTVTPLTGRPIVFELVRETGGVILSKQLAVEQPGEPMDFEVPLAYLPSKTDRDMRLVIRQTIEDYALDFILDSLPIIIEP